MKIVITAGGTEEPIDKVRKITNMSTGKLGSIIANKFKNEDITIFYICNKNSIKPTLEISNANFVIMETTDTNSVQSAINKILNNHKIDFFIHSMAISDYKVDGVYVEDMYGELKEIDTSNKMKSNNEEVFIKLSKTPKIIDSIKKISPNTSLISFKLLNGVSKKELISEALKQMERTSSDMVVANDLEDIKSGNHIAQVITKEEYIGLPNGSDRGSALLTPKVKEVGNKEFIAAKIFNFIY